nr:hypothetical protein [Porphyromonas gingivicanis]
MEKQKIGSFLPKEYDWVDEEVIFSSSPLETSNGLNQDFDSDGEQEDLEGKDREEASKDNVSREGEKEKMAKILLWTLLEQTSHSWPHWGN